MEEPDNVAHGTGPDSEETKAMLKKVNADFRFFQRKMEKAGLLDKVLLVVRLFLSYLQHHVNDNINAFFRIDALLSCYIKNCKFLSIGLSLI